MNLRIWPRHWSSRVERLARLWWQSFSLSRSWVAWWSIDLRFKSASYSLTVVSFLPFLLNLPVSFHEPFLISFQDTEVSKLRLRDCCTVLNLSLRILLARIQTEYLSLATIIFRHRTTWNSCRFRSWPKSLVRNWLPQVILALISPLLKHGLNFLTYITWHLLSLVVAGWCTYRLFIDALSWFWFWLCF